jgi:hypothetical protein
LCPLYPVYGYICPCGLWGNEEEEGRRSKGLCVFLVFDIHLLYSFHLINVLFCFFSFVAGVVAILVPGVTVNVLLDVS